MTTIAHQFRTKSEIAQHYIKELIVSGRVRPGAPIATREVSEALGMSETPVREAIKSLSAEGWLRATAHLGAIVAPLKTSQIREIFLLRGLLNAQAIRLARHAFSPALLEAIDANIAKGQSAVSAGDFDGYSEINAQFHALLCNHPEAEWTYRLFSTLAAQSAMLRRGFRAAPDGIAKSLEAHIAIRDALRADDIDLAAELVYRDEIEACDRLLVGLAVLEHENES